MSAESGIKGIIFDMQGTLALAAENHKGEISMLYEHPGTREGLLAARAAGIQLGLMSSSPEDTSKRILGAMNVDDLFESDAILGSRSTRLLEREVEDYLPATRGLAKTLRLRTLQKVVRPVEVVIPGKPKPDGIAYLLGQWGLTKDEVVSVGDDTYERYAAHEAGIAFADVSHISIERPFEELMEAAREAHQQHLANR